MKRELFLTLALVAGTVNAAPPAPATSSGSVKANASEFRQLVSEGSPITVLADGITWAEGPAWIRDGGYLLFSDPPKDRMYRWAPGDKDVSIFVEPSGAAQTKGLREPGSNGIKPGGSGRVIFADSGDRAVSQLDLRTKAKYILIDRFEGKRLNSPNDLVVARDGAIWFTDPPYGLEGIDDSPLKEQRANRVYRLGPDGTVTAEESQLRYPNGIAFSPDGGTLYVSNSDPKDAVILAWDVSPSGKLSRRRIFADMNALAAKGLPGLPDGMCIDERGDLWASGPGGIHVLSPDGRELGMIWRDVAISNCAFGGPDGRTIFMTSTHQLLALHTNVRGAPLEIPKAPGSRK